MEEELTDFVVTITREDDLWVAVATNPDGSALGALDFADFGDLHETMPQFIADMTGGDVTDVGIVWHYDINGKDVTYEIRLLRDVELGAQRALREQEHARKQLLAALMEAGLSQQVMANVMGLSHQRVHQLVHD